MSELDHSFASVITGTVGGLIIGSVYVWLSSTGLIPSFVFDLIKLASVGAWFVLMRSVSSWSLPYLFGWGLGIFVVYRAGLVSELDLLLYGLIVVLGLYLSFTHERYDKY